MNRQEEQLSSQVKGEEEGDGRAEVLSAIRDEGKTSISFTSDADGSGSGSLLDSILFTFLKKCSSDVGVVALFFSPHRRHSSTGLHCEWLLQPSCAILCLGSGPQKLTVPPQTKKILCHFLHNESLQLLLLVSFCTFSGPPIPSDLH